MRNDPVLAEVIKTPMVLENLEKKRLLSKPNPIPLLPKRDIIYKAIFIVFG